MDGEWIMDNRIEVKQTEKRKVKSYKDLQVWQKGIEITDYVYEITSFFPNEERYGLTSQLQRAAISIPANIAEGFGRHSRKEFIQFCRIALGSCSELETHLLIAKRRNYCSEERFLTLTSELESQSKMLMKLIQSLKQI